MKRNLLIRAGGLTLAAVLALGGLTSCGNSGVDKEKNALAKENVYSYQEIKLPDLGGDYSSVAETFLADGRAYVLMRVEHYTDGNNNVSYHLVSFTEEGSDIQDVEIEINKTVITDEEMNGGLDGEEGAEGDIDDGMLDDVVPLPMPRAEDVDIDIDEDTEVDADTDVDSDVDTDLDSDMAVDEGFSVDYDVDYDSEWVPPDYYEYTYLNNFVFSNGVLYGVRNYNYSNYQNGFDVSYTYLCCWNLDGSLRWENELENLRSDEDYMWIQRIGAASDGSLNILLSGSGVYVLNVAADGHIGQRREVSDEAYDILNNNWFIEPKENGKFMVVYYDMDDWTKQYIVDYDPDTDKLGEATLIPGTILYSNNSMDVGNSSDLIYTTNNGVFTYNVGDEAGTKLMDFINSDLNISSLYNVIELDDKHFIGLFYENYDYDNQKCGLFTYIPPEEIPDKKVMVMASLGVNSELRQRVVEYNRSSQEYKITIKDYSEYATYEDYDNSVTVLNNDIISGNMPDILVANSRLPMSKYIAKKMFADINGFIKDDEELSQVEFVQNVFDAFSVKGKLYYIIPGFTARTVIGKSAIVGDRTSWTMEDMLSLKQSLPEGTTMIEGLSRPYFFSTVMEYCGNDFIDVETGKCAFDSPAFIELMEYAKTLPEEFNYEDDYWMYYESQYRDERTILMNAYINSIQGFNYTLNGYFGEDISYIGFPNASGMGAYVDFSYNGAYCIADKSPNKKGAWEFLRYYLTEEYQDSTDRYPLPTRKDIFEKKAQEARNRPYWLDENGEKQEYDDYFYMNGEDILLEPMSQEQIDKLVNYIYSINNAYYYNEDILNIINEEMDAFYSGQKSAEDVANIIQRRAQVYVDENS